MTLRERILRALGPGPLSSADLAKRLRKNRARVSVELSLMAAEGAIQRAGVANLGARGRPCVRWRRPEVVKKRRTRCAVG
jgi:predicted ArsR family transcriptional regulator